MITLSDGTQLTMSDSHSGPDGKPGCQRVGSALWIKKPGDTEWSHTGFRSTTAAMRDGAPFAEELRAYYNLT